MRFLVAFLLSLLPYITAAAKKGHSPDIYSVFHSKLITSTPLKLDDRSFSKITSLPRNHTVVVLLTALGPKYGCQLCRDFQPEWEVLAKSWTQGDKSGDGKLLWGTLDFVDGKQTFQSMQLQTAPILLLYQPTIGAQAKADGQPVRFDFSTGSESAESIHSWISRQLPDNVPHPAFRRPFNYIRTITITTAALGAITCITVAYPYILPLLGNRNLWAAISLVTILLFTSGHMFNRIRSTPYVGGNGKGGVSYFAGGFQNQFGLESQIVAAIYGVLSFATISLALKVPRMREAKSQQIAVLAWGAVMFSMYSFLLSVFRVKNGGYPFWLPPF